jgi:G3E family GTPase
MTIPVPPSTRLPVSVLTGFLGSGKTTLLQALLRHPGMSKTAVVINEFGEVGLDHLLVSNASENLMVMDGGCICCTVRGDLVDTLRDLFVKRVRQEIPEFDRVVIETTGLADPAPIIHTLMTDPLLSARYRLDGVVSTVDAAHGEGQLDHHPESVKQAAVADRIVLTKTDIVPAETIADLKARLKELNRAAPVFDAPFGKVDPARLFDAGLYNPATKSPDVARWLNEEAYAEEEEEHVCGPDCGHHHHDHGHDHGHGHHHHHDDHDHGHGHHHHARHDDHIRSFCLIEDEPVAWDRVVDFMENLIAERGGDILRVKGILNVVESGEKPIVIHGVQHMFHPPVQLEDWPSDDRRSRIVFITHDIDRDDIATRFARLVRG